MFSKKAFQSIAEDKLVTDLPKKRYLLIGGTAGIGKALAQSLLKRNAQVTIVGRRQPDDSLSKATFVQRDLSLMKNAKKLAEDIDVLKFDVMVFTNGIISRATRTETPEGIEEDLAVSYLSRYAFIKRALELGFAKERMDMAVKPRIFIMGYPGKKMVATVDDMNCEKEYKQMTAHFNTVVANEALVADIGDKNPSINVYGLNPGLIQTDIRVNALGKGVLYSLVETGIGLFCKSAEKYAESVLIPLLITPDIESQSKLLFESNGTLLKSNPFLTVENQAKVINSSDELLSKAYSAA